MYGKMIPSPFLNLHVPLPNNPVLNTERSEDEDPSDSAQVALAMAQQVDMTSKTAASIK